MELVDFRPLPAEGAHHPHAGEVFLGHGGKLALVLIAVGEALVNLLVENQGIQKHHRHGNQRDQRQKGVHGQHEDHGQHQQNQNPEDGGHLLGEEIAGGVDVGGTALNDVAGPVFHVPGEGQALNVIEQLVPHALDQGFGGLGVADPEAVLAGHLHRRHDHNGQTHDPQMLSQVRKASRRVYQAHDGRGEGGRLAADGVVHRRTDDLGLNHVRQSRNGRGKDAQRKKTLGAFQEMPQKLRLFAFFSFGFGWIVFQHVSFSGSFLLTQLNPFPRSLRCQTILIIIRNPTKCNCLPV